MLRSDTLGNSPQCSMKVKSFWEKRHQRISKWESDISLWDHFNLCSFFITDWGRCEINHLESNGMQHMRVSCLLIVRAWRECRTSQCKVGTGLRVRNILMVFTSINWSRLGNSTKPYISNAKMSSNAWKLIALRNSRAFFIRNLARKPLTPLLVSQLASMSDRFRCNVDAMSSYFRAYSEPVKGI